MIQYLLMVREQVKDILIDNAISFAYAKLEKISDLENFLNNPNSIDC